MTRRARGSPERSHGSPGGNRFDTRRLKEELKPFRLHYFGTLKSTNSHAAVMRREGRLFAPAVVLAGRQTAGRGRGGNTWFSSGGSITVTFAMPVEEHLEAHQLPLVAGLAAREACAEVANRAGVQLKWPNDLLFEGKKLAGLLCERIDRADLIGIGINVNTPVSKAPAALRAKITSLAEIAGRELDLNEVLIAVAKHLYRMLRSRNEHTFAAFLAEYDRHHALVGKRVTVVGAPGEPAVTGVCRGMDSTGRLIVGDRGKTHRIVAGHVVL